MSISRHKSASGHAIAALHINDNYAVVAVTLDEIESLGLRRPSVLEKSTKKETRDDARLNEAKELHDMVQRRFDAARLRRAAAYSDYIEGFTCLGRKGGTPPVILWHQDPLDGDDESLVIPYNSALVAIDGETQTEARFLLRQRRPETGSERFVAVIYHGLPVENAQQLLHDFNTYVHPVSPQTCAAFNHEGRITNVVDQLIDNMGVEPNRVHHHNKVAPYGYALSKQQLIALVMGYAIGEGVTRGRQPQLRAMQKDCNADLSLASDRLKGIGQVVERHELLGKADPLVWKSLGAAVVTGTPIESANVLAGIEAYHATSPKAAGRRVPAPERANVIIEAMRRS